MRFAHKVHQHTRDDHDDSCEVESPAPELHVRQSPPSIIWEDGMYQLNETAT